LMKIIHQNELPAMESRLVPSVACKEEGISQSMFRSSSKNIEQLDRCLAML